MLEYGYEYGDADYKEADSATETPTGAGAAGARTEVKPARRSPPGCAVRRSRARRPPLAPRCLRAGSRDLRRAAAVPRGRRPGRCVPLSSLSLCFPFPLSLRPTEEEARFQKEDVDSGHY